jgi:hypothetical protein
MENHKQLQSDRASLTARPPLAQVIFRAAVVSIPAGLPLWVGLTLCGIHFGSVSLSRRIMQNTDAQEKHVIDSPHPEILRFLPPHITKLQSDLDFEIAAFVL